jgi:hypothetical protein
VRDQYKLGLMLLSPRSRSLLRLPQRLPLRLMVATNLSLKLRLNLLHTLRSQLSLLGTLPLLFPPLPLRQTPTTHTLLLHLLTVDTLINLPMRLSNRSLNRVISLHTDRMGTPVIPNLRDTVVDTLPTSNLSNNHTVCNPDSNNLTAHPPLKPSLLLHELSIPTLPLLHPLFPPLKDVICRDGTMLLLSLLHLKDLNQHLSCRLSPIRHLIQWHKLVWLFKDKDHPGQLHLHLGINLVSYRLHPREPLGHHQLRQ